MVQETIPWHIKRMLFKKAFLKARMQNGNRQICLPNSKGKEFDFSIYRGKAYYWFNTALPPDCKNKDKITSSCVAVDLINGEFPN